MPFLLLVCFINLAGTLLPFGTLPGFVSTPAWRKGAAELLHGLSKPHGPEGTIAADRQEAMREAVKAGSYKEQCCWKYACPSLAAGAARELSVLCGGHGWRKR